MGTNRSLFHPLQHLLAVRAHARRLHVGILPKTGLGKCSVPDSGILAAEAGPTALSSPSSGAPPRSGSDEDWRAVSSARAGRPKAFPVALRNENGSILEQVGPAPRGTEPSCEKPPAANATGSDIDVPHATASSTHSAARSGSAAAWRPILPLSTRQTLKEIVKRAKSNAFDFPRFTISPAGWAGPSRRGRAEWRAGLGTRRSLRMVGVAGRGRRGQAGGAAARASMVGSLLLFP